MRLPSGWSFCSRLTAIHADTGDAWAASIRPGMGQFVVHAGYQRDPGRDGSEEVKGAVWPVLGYALRPPGS